MPGVAGYAFCGHCPLQALHQQAVDALEPIVQDKHNGFLKELGLKLLP